MGKTEVDTVPIFWLCISMGAFIALYSPKINDAISGHDSKAKKKQKGKLTPPLVVAIILIACGVVGLIVTSLG